MSEAGKGILKEPKEKLFNAVHKVTKANRLFVEQENTKKIEQFLTRAEKMKRTTFPSSKKNLVIVKAKKDGIGFREKTERE